MFDIGFSELLVIAVVALIVIGPERLPKVARTLGHLFGRMQRYVNDVKADISREMELDELQQAAVERARTRRAPSRARSTRRSTRRAASSTRWREARTGSGARADPQPAAPDDAAPSERRAPAAAARLALEANARRRRTQQA